MGKIGKIYDAVMKGPPRWFRRTGIALSAAAAALVVLTIGVQLGLWHERSKNTAEAIATEMAKKDAAIDQLKIALNDTQYDLAVERVKMEVLICESDMRHEGIWGDGGNAYGIAQFWPRTFRWLANKAGRPELRRKNRADQLWLFDWALRHGYGFLWTCYRNAQSAESIVQSVNNGGGR